MVLTRPWPTEEGLRNGKGRRCLSQNGYGYDDADGDDVTVVGDVGYAGDAVYNVCIVVGTLGMVKSQFAWVLQGRLVASWSWTAQGRHQYQYAVRAPLQLIHAISEMWHC